MNDETQPLIDLLRNAAARPGAPLNPAWLANAALIELDPHGSASPLMRAACLIQLRELAEGLLGSAKPPLPAPPADAALLRRGAKKDFEQRPPSQGLGG